MWRILGLVSVLLLTACAATPEQRQERDAGVDLATAREQAEAAYADGRWRDAEPHYLVLARAMPQDEAFWFRLGNIYARTERPDAAVAAYREALVRDADNAKVWFNMGVVQLRQAANSFLQMGVNVDSDDPLAASGAEAYAAIMAVLGGDGEQHSVPATSPVAPPAGEPVAADDAAADPDVEPVAADDAVAEPDVEPDDAVAEPEVTEAAGDAPTGADDAMAAAASGPSPAEAAGTGAASDETASE